VEINQYSLFVALNLPGAPHRDSYHWQINCSCTTTYSKYSSTAEFLVIPSNLVPVPSIMEATHPATSSAADEPSQAQDPALPPVEMFGLDVSLTTLLVARSLTCD